MTDKIKTLIEYIVHNDMLKARKQTEIILKENSTAKDTKFCESMLKKIQSTPTFIQLPQNISELVIAEDLSLSFNENRYYLSLREKKVFEEIKNADKINHKLTEKGLRYVNSTILYGESGTGKTTFGKYVAYKLGIPFIYLNFANLISSYLGKTGQNIYNVFNYVQNQRCVLMLDEIDAVGLARGQQNEVGEMPRIVISLMQSLDMIGNDVIIIAATNRVEAIDNALLRRFTRQHEVKPLDDEEKIKFMKKYFEFSDFNFDDKYINDFSKKWSNKQSELEKEIIRQIITLIESEVEE